MKNFEILSLFLILTLTTSPTMLVDGKAFAIDLEKQQTIFENKQIIEQKDLEQKPKHNFVTLTESISVQTDEQKKNSESQNVHIFVELHEEISVSEDSTDDVVLLIKGNDDRKTMMERIFDRSKLHRVISDSSVPYSIQNDMSLASFTNNPQSEYSYYNLDVEIDQRLGTFLIDYSISERQLETSYENPGKSFGQLIVSTNSLLDVHVIPLSIFLIYFMSFFVLGGSFVVF